MRNTGKNDMGGQKPAPEKDVDPDSDLGPTTQLVREWAQAEIPVAATDLDILHATLADDVQRQSRRTMPRWLQFSAALVSAASLVVALSLIHVRLEWQGNVVEFGGTQNGADAITSDQLTALEARFKMNQDALSAQLSGLLQKTTGLESTMHETATLLSERQQAESATRYRDIQRLLAISSGN